MSQKKGQLQQVQMLDRQRAQQAAADAAKKAALKARNCRYQVGLYKAEEGGSHKAACQGDGAAWHTAAALYQDHAGCPK